jgi:hypothetical protein
MTETEKKELLKQAVLKRWEDSKRYMLEDLSEKVNKLEIELADKRYSNFDLPHSTPSIETIKEELWFAYIEAYKKKDRANGSIDESEEAGHNALDKYLEKMENVNFKEDTQGEKTEKIDREAGLAELRKINWGGTETQLVLLVDLLTREALLKSDRKWKMIEEHFLVQGKPTKSKNLSQSLENTLAGKTKDLKTFKEIISKVKKLED